MSAPTPDRPEVQAGHEIANLTSDANRLIINKTWRNEQPTGRSYRYVTMGVWPQAFRQVAPAVAENVQSLSLDAHANLNPICTVQIRSDGGSSECTIVAAMALNDGFWSVESRRYRFNPGFDAPECESSWLIMTGDEYGATTNEDLLRRVGWSFETNSAVDNMRAPLPRLDSELTTHTASADEIRGVMALANQAR